MRPAKIVLLVIPYDQGDILTDFLDWHLDLGIDLILAQDGGSSDGSREILDQYSKTGRVAWFPLPERDMTKYNFVDTMAEIARDKYEADWLIMIDADEFLCSHGPPLRTVLAKAEADGVSVLEIKRHNMTGALMEPGQRATEALNLKLNAAVVPTDEQRLSGELPVPFLFLEVGGKVAVQAAAFSAYGMGMHSAQVSRGATLPTEELYILHYAIRGFEELETKVDNTRRWLSDNPHLPPDWAWHWRRWIRLQDEGRLREDYENEFVSADRAQELIAEGVCQVDDTIVDWLAARQAQSARSRGLPERLTSVLKSAFARRS